MKRVPPFVLAMLCILAVAGCSADGTRAIDSGRLTRSSGIVVGAFNFSESSLLAQLYGQALSARGFEVRILDEGAPREVLDPALEQGVIDLVLEYQGTVSRWFGLDETTASVSPRETHRRLQSLLAERGLRALQFAAAENKNEVVVTKETAAKYSLRTVSDLAPVAGEFVFAGPPECRTRALCLEGLESVYGLRFRFFQPLDAGGPLTVSAIKGGEVDVALMFTTDPAIRANGLMVLKDDRRLQPAENIVPVVNNATFVRHGTAMVEVLNGVSEHLSPQALRGMNRQVAAGTAPQDAAHAWLSSQGLGKSR